MNTKIKYQDVSDACQDIATLIQRVQENIPLIQNLTGNTTAWSSKYQRAFDRHINGETIVYLKKVVNGLKGYNEKLSRYIKEYQQIDIYR